MEKKNVNFEDGLKGFEQVGVNRGQIDTDIRLDAENERLLVEKTELLDILHTDYDTLAAEYNIVVAGSYFVEGDKSVGIAVFAEKGDEVHDAVYDPTPEERSSFLNELDAHAQRLGLRLADYEAMAVANKTNGNALDRYNPKTAKHKSEVER